MGVIPRGNNKLSFFWFPACAVSLACLEGKGPFLNWVFQQSLFQTMTCPCTPCLNLSFSGHQKEHQTPPHASLKRMSAQTGRHSDRWTLRSLSTTKKAPASWMQPLPYHGILSVSLHQLETHYNHHCLFLAKHILIEAVTFTVWYRPMCGGLSAALTPFL